MAKKIDWKKGEAERAAPSLIVPTKEMVFVSLHHHTTFSYLDGYGLPESHNRRAAELGMTALAVTEHGNVSSHVRHEQAGDEFGVRSLYGCELYCGEVGEGATQRKNHLTVLAATDEGYRNLLRVVSLGWAEGFYYEPTVSGSMLAAHKEGLIILSGCSGSLLATSLIGGKNIPEEEASYQRAKRQAEKFRDHFGDAFYLEVQAFPELEKTRAINAGYSRLSQELGIPLVATLDAHYTQPNEAELQAILHNLRPGKQRTIEDQYRSWGYDVPLSILTDKEIYQRLVHTGLTKKEAEGAIRITREIADRCDVRLPKVENLTYPLPPEHDSPQSLFRQWVNEGWKFRGMNKLPEMRDYAGRTALERAHYEMGMIESKGFIDYFLIESETVVWAKNNGIAVGPARGSAAASLICYLLRITEVNPMLFPTLLFERFIDINRHDLPDIDLDFDDEMRYMIKDHLADKYGEEKVGQIGTFVKFKGKNSLDDIARVFQIPKEDIKVVKDLLITRSSGDLRAGSTIEDSMEMFPQVKEVFEKYPELYKATLLEGNYKSMSIHAAGLVVANGPLTDVCAVYTRTDSDGVTTQVVSLDKYDAEYLNVMKLDMLGLNTMALVRIALEYIGMSLNELYSTPLDLEPVIDGFREGDVSGIFQFDGRAMRSVNQGVKPDNFMEVCDINALARPGPLHSGATAEYIDVKMGRKEATHYHEIIDGITQHTNFQVVYQEQILQVVRLLGGFSWEDAARIRKIISKKRGEQEFNRQRDKFVDGAATHGMDGTDANAVFSMLATAGAYAFNAAHCVSYGMLAYWTMWLKRNFPAEFYIGALRKYGTGNKENEKRAMQLLTDTTKFGRSIPVKSMNLNKSDKNWTLDDEGAIRPGLVQVKGIGDKTADALLSRREEVGRFDDWDDVAEVKGIGPKTIELMREFATNADPFNLNVLSEKVDEMRKALEEGIDDGSGVFSLPTPTHTAEEIPYERTEGNVNVVWLGVVRDRNLKDLFENHHSRTGQHLDPANVKDPHLNEWVVMTCEDETDVVTVTINRWRYRSFKNLIWSIKPNEDLVLVRGYKMGVQARRALYVTDMWVLDTSEDD